MSFKSLKVKKAWGIKLILVLDFVSNCLQLKKQINSILKKYLRMGSEVFQETLFKRNNQSKQEKYDNKVKFAQSVLYFR